MDKIRLFIVTYNRIKALHETLYRLFDTDFADEENSQVVIINNHPNFHLDGPYIDKVDMVLHNMTRQPCSYGNLSENYNQALVWGFGNLIKPETEIVTHIQDDCMLDKNWYTNLRKLHEKYSFVVGKYGDNIVSYTPEAVRRIGMWDENFCGIQHKEADYWIRALIWNKAGSMIDDIQHNRTLNNEDAPTLDIMDGRNFNLVGNRWKRGQDDKEHIVIKRHAQKANDILRTYFYEKWEGTWNSETRKNLVGWLAEWSKEFVEHPPTYPNYWPTFYKYPWFERDIYDLSGKGYLV